MVRLCTEVTLTFVLRKETVLESGKEALKPMGAEGLKKKQFIAYRTNSKVNSQGHSERFKMNDSYAEALFVFRSLTEVPFLCSEYLPDVYNLISIVIYSSQPPTNGCERT